MFCRKSIVLLEHQQLLLLRIVTLPDSVCMLVVVTYWQSFSWSWCYVFLINVFVCRNVLFIKIYKLDWGVYTGLTQLYDGRDMYRIYYIKNNSMFRLFTLPIIRLRNEKTNKQLYSSCVGCVQWGGKRWGGCEISRVLYRMGGVGTWGFCYYMLF